MVRILHTADVHLDAPFHFLGEKGATHRKQIQQTFERIAILAATERYDLLLIAGDLFNDNRPTRATQHFVLNTLSALPLPVCILPGNHDYLDNRSVYHKLEFPPNVHILTERPTFLEFPELDLTIAGNPIQSRYDNTPQLKDITRNSSTRWFIAMAHGNMQIPGTFEATSRPIEPQSIVETVADYVALGDWHSFAEYSQEGTKAFYAGAPEPTSVNETDTGMVANIVLSENEVTVTPKQIGCVNARTMELNITGQSVPGIIEVIQAEAAGHRMLSVDLIGLKSAEELLDLDEIFEATADDFYWLQIKDKSVISVDQIDPNEYPRDFVIGQYVQLMTERIMQSQNDREQRIAERALQLGVALLKGHKVL